MYIGGKTTKTGLFLVLSFAIGLAVYPISAQAKPSPACWEKYPDVSGSAQLIPGFPTNDSFSDSKCVKDSDVCKSAGLIPAPGNSGMGCPTGVCCLTPQKPLGCYNDYVGEDRVNIQSATCVKDSAACASPNKVLGEGHGCDPAKANTCCAIMGGAKGGAASGAAAAAGAAIPDTGSTAEWKYQNPEKTGLLLVDCTNDGNCEIADLVQQGINFAKWLMGLSGALFLIVFVYGGAMYLASFGRSDYVKKGQNAMVRGAFGIILVMGAWTIVSYVATSLGYKPVGLGASGGETGGKKGVCGSEAGTEGKQCFDTKKDTDKFEAGSCVQGYCSGAAEIQCCKPKAGSAAAAGTGSCNCTGTVTEGLALKLLPGDIFDSYCADVKSYCPVCGGGTATCAISIDVSKEECDKQDFDALAQKLGIPSPALNAVNLSGTCTYK